MKTIILSGLAGCLVAAAMPASAQYGGQYGGSRHGTREQREDNADQRADIRARMSDLDQRIVAAQGNGDLDRGEALSMRRQIAQMRRYYQKSVRAQGFVSGAESASYARTMDDIEAKLPN